MTTLVAIAVGFAAGYLYAIGKGSKGTLANEPDTGGDVTPARKRGKNGRRKERR